MDFVSFLTFKQMFCAYPLVCTAAWGSFLLGFINILGIIYFSSLSKSVRETLFPC